jgi:hypothetical protein
MHLRRCRHNASVIIKQVFETSKAKRCKPVSNGDKIILIVVADKHAAFKQESSSTIKMISCPFPTCGVHQKILLLPSQRTDLARPPNTFAA